MNWITVGGLLSILSSICVAILAIAFFRHLNKQIKIISVLFIISGGIDVFLSYHWIFGTEVSTVWTAHFITLAQYSFFTWVFSSWQESPTIQKGLRWSILIFLIIWMLAKLIFEDFSQYDTYTSTIAGLVLAGLSSFILYELSVNNHTNMYQESRFWIAAGALLYFTGNLFFWALTNIILNLMPPEEAQALWAISWFVNIVANGLYAKGLLCQRPR